ncbi:ABC transporter substrate-binding protein [Shewanella nanhaiensis]|uniref:ABC transporter substrate-binding protein n=1 Tax=Shewanella nanhaiensis TaxID=2864872 RepID=A0ABS7E8K3_9GAMM|nr:ABC transporter substrate-binding protein [Shewanella nanhaiensis]MBW8185653.1 ABC transporter substrate-binding protein [Shewanella nanhaiensis]
MLRFTASLFISLLLVACSPQPVTKTITIAINPWPGYELLYLAENKGFFKQVGLDIKLSQTATLSDAQRAYISGRVDGFASTIVEAVQAQEFGGDPLKIVLLADYSNGGDLIVSHEDFKTLKQLEGRKVGCEVSSLGIYILARALAVYDMSLDDVEIVNMEQGNALQALNSNQIDAMVTYPPYSFEILNSTSQKNHKVFTTSEIPNEILDTVSFSQKVIKANPDLVFKLQQAWQLAYDYLEQHPDDAIELMAEREQISVDEFSQALADIYLLNNVDQEKLLKENKKLTKLAQSVCDTLNKVGAFDSSCDHVETLFYTGI